MDSNNRVLFQALFFNARPRKEKRKEKKRKEWKPHDGNTKIN